MVGVAVITAVVHSTVTLPWEGDGFFSGIGDKIADLLPFALLNLVPLLGLLGVLATALLTLKSAKPRVAAPLAFGVLGLLMILLGAASHVLYAIEDAGLRGTIYEAGSYVAVLELSNKCSSFNGVPHWQFTDCCTDALQISIAALTNQNDVVIVPSYGWRAFANAVAFMNRRVRFCDIDESGNIDLNQLADMIPRVKPKAVVIVHNFGTVTRVDQIIDLCNKWGGSTGPREGILMNFFILHRFYNILSFPLP